MKSRIVFLFAVFCCLWSILIFRAASLQVFPNSRLRDLQARQFRTVITLPARRGAITDRSGRELALSATAFSLYADPKLLENRKQVAKQLAKELNQPVGSIYWKIRDPQKRFVWVERLLDPATADRVRALNIHGLSLVEEWRRVYPNESLLAHSLGFLGVDGQPLEGLELQYDETLRGNLKKVSVRRDARGRPLVADGLLFQENADGKDVKLTVDAEIQYMLETELQSAVTNFEADSAVGVVLDAQTSAIRALSSVPSFDANHALKAGADHRRNRSITDVFEPGSTMKTFVVAAALKAKKLQPNSRYFCENGAFKVGDRVIHEAEASHSFGWLSASEILAHSSNIGATKIAFSIGEQAVRQSYLDFGFDAKSGVDLPGESKGILKPLPWNPHLFANISFGHGLMVTPLQVANAYAAVANGGILNTPYIVDSVHDVDTGISVETKPKMVRRVLTPEESAQMRMMLMSVTSPGGSGVNAKVNGFVVAGKTGTAQVADPKGGGYMKNAYYSSFAGFIPAHDPRFVIYVAVDHPRKAFYGAQVAAPIFSKIASYAVRREGIAPMVLSERNLIHNKQVLPRGPLLEPAEDLTLVTDLLKTRSPAEAQTVPELNHLSLREVLRRVNGQDMNIKVIGRGLVSETVPAAGEPIPATKDVTVILK